MKYGPWMDLSVEPNIGDLVQIEYFCACRSETRRVEVLVTANSPEMTGMYVGGLLDCTSADPTRWRRIYPPEAEKKVTRKQEVDA